MERWNGRVALVTGASVGIGAAICRELVKHGMTVIGCARNVKKIEDLAREDGVLICPGRIHAMKCNLAVESEILAMFDEIRQKFGRIDVCINNAGLSTDSPLLSGEISDWRSMLEVNVLAVCICNRETFKIMKEKGIDDGQIINISRNEILITLLDYNPAGCEILRQALFHSQNLHHNFRMGGHRIATTSNNPGINFYCGTKFMVRALTEGLRREVKSANTRIRVASISPGIVETEFFTRLYKDKPEAADTVYSSIECLQANDIADAVTYILKMPPHVDVNDILIRPLGQAY